MSEWMQYFIEDTIVNKSNVILVVSKHLNPESYYYYQDYTSSKYRDVEASEILDKEDKRPI